MPIRQLTKTSQITIPLQQRPAKVFGPFATGNLPATLQGYALDFVNDATWPTDGSDVMIVTVEQSNDAGQTWAFDASNTFTADPWTDRQGNVIHTADWNVELDNQGSTTRQVRVTFNLLQSVAIGVTVSSF